MENQKTSQTNFNRQPADEQFLPEFIQRPQQSKSKKLLIIIVIGLLLAIIGGVSAYFLLFKSRQKVKEKNVLERQLIFEGVVIQYADIRNSLAGELGEEIQEIADNQGASSQHNRNFFYVNRAFAQDHSLTRGELIARGLATFLEIGRNKDIAGAKRINSEDLDYIYMAQSSLNDIYKEVHTISGSKQWHDEDMDKFFELLLRQYENTNKLLDELLAYKKFHASELFAVRLEKMSELTNEQLQIWENLLKFGKDSKSVSYLKDITPNYLDNLEELNNLLKESIEGLRIVRVPEDIDSRKILEDRLQLRIDTYNVAIRANNKQIEDIESVGIPISPVSEYRNSFSLEATELQAQMEKNLFTYKSISKSAKLFQDIITTDNELITKTESLGEKFDILFFAEDNIHLEDLMAVFYRKERGELQERLDRLEVCLKEEVVPLKQKTSEFIVDKQYHRIVVALLTDGSADNIIFRLETPSGKIIDKNIAEENKNIRFAFSETYQLYEIKSPELGNWNVLLEGLVGQKTNIKVSVF